MSSRSLPLDLNQLDISNLLSNSLHGQLNDTFAGHMDSLSIPSSLQQRIADHSRQFNELASSIARLTNRRTTHDDMSQVSEPQEDERRYPNIRPSRRRFTNRIYQTNPYINEVGTNVFWRTQLGSLHEVEILEVLPVTLTHAHLSYKVKNGQDVAVSTARHDDLYLPMGNTFQDP